MTLLLKGRGSGETHLNSKNVYIINIGREAGPIGVWRGTLICIQFIGCVIVIARG